MEIVEKNTYTAIYDPATATVTFRGMLRLIDWHALRPIETLLNDAINARPKAITLDLHELETLNSTGIDMLYRFALTMSRHRIDQLVVRRARQTPWQDKLLSTIERLVPGLQVELIDGEEGPR